MGSGGPVLALTHACKMVRSPTLFADCTISRAVISSYPGRGAPAMAALVAVIARVVVVSCFTPFDVILFGTTVFAAFEELDYFIFACDVGCCDLVVPTGEEIRPILA